MTLEEENALCYVEGYVCRKVRDEIIKSSVKDKEELILFCFELCGDEDCKCSKEEWINLIDRGGLWHVNDFTYTVISILEDEIRRHLKFAALKSPNEKQRGLTIFESIMKNEDLKFQRTLITANSDDSIGIEVLHQISELYLTVCGFAFASNYLELYKHCSQKPIQKFISQCKKVTNTEDHCD